MISKTLKQQKNVYPSLQDYHKLANRTDCLNHSVALGKRQWEEHQPMESTVAAIKN